MGEQQRGLLACCELTRLLGPRQLPAGGLTLNARSRKGAVCSGDCCAGQAVLLTPVYSSSDCPACPYRQHTATVTGSVQEMIFRPN